ncbi:hypothetical protein PtB15_17B115 [Puccinia triticina]|nr:hypothetical protein PtB15_17B115 [Puccinia triticina]
MKQTQKQSQRSPSTTPPSSASPAVRPARTAGRPTKPPARSSTTSSDAPAPSSSPPATSPPASSSSSTTRPSTPAPSTDTPPPRTSPPSPSPPPPDHSPPAFRSPSLNHLRQLTLARNAQVSTNDIHRAYSLWALASGDDAFPYSRSRSPPDSPLRAPSKGKAKRDALSSSEEEDDDSRSGSSSSGQQASVMPSYERWTRAQLENESERLGYPDGPRLATAALVARAQAAWARQQPASPSRSDAEPDAGSSGSADDDRPGSRADPQEETREDSLEWELNLLNPADHALFAASDADDGPAVRPCFESFSRAQLEREHAALAHRIRARPADAAEPARVPAARAALDSMPKTKPALARKVLRLWDALHPLPADPPAAVRIVSVKLDLAGLSRVMACLLAIDPALYLRILRFEVRPPPPPPDSLPHALTIRRDKVRAVLDQEFEARFAQHLRQREDAGRAEGLSSAGSSDDDSGEDALDEAPAKRPAPKAPRPRRSPPALSKHVLHADTLARWLDLQAISYFLLDPAVPRKPRY